MPNQTSQKAEEPVKPLKEHIFNLDAIVMIEPYDDDWSWYVLEQSHQILISVQGGLASWSATASGWFNLCEPTSMQFICSIYNRHLIGINH